MLRKHLFIIIIFFLPGKTISQKAFFPKVEVIHSGVKTSLRGLSVVNDNIIWVSGSNGIVGRSTNGGKNWKWITVKGFEKNDFRDIEAFDAQTAVIMAIADPAFILRTTDGGESWQVVYENQTKGMFLDAMEFKDVMNGIVIGDPIDGRFFLAKTTDGGKTWKELPADQRPVADSGEACFASSGTNIRFLYNQSVYFISGGRNSRFFNNYSPSDLPIIKGLETTGANSIAVWDNYKKGAGKNIIVVGGDFTKDTATFKNCFYSTDGGKSWHSPKRSPSGYRSCVEYLNKEQVVTCGLNGVDYTVDGGKSWRKISNEGFHICRFAKFGNTVFLAGSNGKIGKLVWN